MSRIRKYRPGRQVRTTIEAVRRVLAGEYLFVRDRPQHPGWIASQHLQVLHCAVMNGVVRRAELTKEWKELNK